MSRTPSTLRTTAAAGAAALAAVAALSGCSSSDSDQAGSTGKSSDMSSSMSSPMSSPMSGSSSKDMGADPAAGPVGPGCAEYAKANPSGPASVGGMAQEPVATAASGNPMLKTLTQAVTGKVNPKVNLADTLNSGEYTVFAPTDSAFQKVDKATMDKLKTDDTMLTNLLSHHVIKGKIQPDAIDGTHETLAGDKVMVSGPAENLAVGDSAHVVCGGVQTSNAVVYMVDSVLMPMK